MSGFTRVNGNAHEVFAIDTLNGAKSGAISSAALVQIAGPKLDYFKIIANDGAAAVDLRSQLGAGGAVEAILGTVSQVATIHFYQVEGDASGQVSVGVYPAGAWTTDALQTAVRALGTVNGADIDGSTVATTGFKLA